MRRGSLLLEAIVAIAIFAVFLGGIGLTLMVGERTTVVGGDRSTATFIAERALEGMRSIANTNFTSLAPGTYGISATSTGWTVKGEPVVYGSGFVSKIQIVSNGLLSPPGCNPPDCYQALSTVGWNFGNTRSGSVVLRTYIANWHKVTNLGNWAGMTRLSKTTRTDTANYGRVAVSGNYAYVLGSSISVASTPSARSRVYAWYQSVRDVLVPHARAAGGDGLYIYDITNMNLPVRVAPGFNLGLNVEGYDIAIHGTGAYIITSDDAAEVKVIDITNPLSPIIRATYDTPGSGTGRVLAYVQNGPLDGDVLYIGGTTGTVDALLFKGNTNTFQQLRSIAGLGGAVTGINLNSAFAYVSVNAIGQQLQVLDIFDPQQEILLTFTYSGFLGSGGGSAVASTNTGLILGRLQDLNANAYEVNLVQIGDSSGPFQPVPIDAFDVTGNVRSVGVTVDGRYAFIGSNNATGQIRVVDMGLFSRGNQGLSSIVNTYNAGEAIGTTLYDPSKNRMFATSDTSLYIFAPG